jgi:hypothetical protein
MTVKRYSVAYWVDPKDDGDPDRSDYSDDKNELEAAMVGKQHDDGRPFKRAILSWLCTSRYALSFTR